jgi:hypothetical protein
MAKGRAMARKALITHICAAETHRALAVMGF